MVGPFDLKTKANFYDETCGFITERPFGICSMIVVRCRIQTCDLQSNESKKKVNQKIIGVKCRIRNCDPATLQQI
jgi:hypothetical protein